MNKEIKLKPINTIVNSDYISRINEVFDNVKNITLEVKIEKYKKLEFENNILVILQLEDNTASKITALLNGSRDDEKFKEIANRIAMNRYYRVIGNISFINDDVYKNLNDICDNKINIKDYIVGNKILFVKGIQSIDNIYSAFEKIKIFDTDINIIEKFDLKTAYEFINKNTDYLKNISYDEVKDINITRTRDIIIVLKNGLLLFNGKERLNNINTLGLSSGLMVYAISNDNIITFLNYQDEQTNFMNNNNYRYKKIITTVLGITALTYENTIRFYGTLVESIIDYEKFYDVEDIGYVENDDEIVIIKNNEVKYLFRNKIYSNQDIITAGKGNDYIILENNN